MMNILKTTIKGLLALITLTLTLSCEEATNEIPSPSGHVEEIVPTNNDFTIEQLKFPKKKGVCMTLREIGHAKGGTYDVNTAKIIELGAGWNYSWGSGVNPIQPEGIEFVPMIFQSHNGSETMKTNLQTNVYPNIVNGKFKKLLGFNEPEQEEQANMTVEQALEVWAELEAMGVPLGSPGAAKPETDVWLEEFMAGIEERGLRVDYICFHHYGGASSRTFINKCKRIYEKYQLPLVITEMAVADWQTTTVEQNKFSPAQVLTFMKEATTWMEETDYIYGYCWFSFNQTRANGTSSALYDQNGKLTALGEYYASIQ